MASKISNQYAFRINWLQPPFANMPRCGRAAFTALKQQDFLEAVVGDPKGYWRTCKALFTCGSPLAATRPEGDGLLDGNAEKAGQMLKEASYDGTPVVLLQSTDVAVFTNLAPVAKRRSNAPASRSRSSPWTGRAW